MALPDRHERLPRHARRPQAPRAPPIDLGPAGTVDGELDVAHRRSPGSSRSPTRRSCRKTAIPPSWSPRARALRLAFVAALQHLPARQRAVLILREVLRWKATEVAELLDTTRGVGEQRAPAGARDARRADLSRGDAAEPVDGDQRELLDRYVEAFERYDMEALVSLLHEDAIAVDAAVRPLAAGRRRDRRLEPRAGVRLPRLASGSDDRERPAGLRAVPPEWPGRRVRAVGAPGDRGLRRADRRRRSRSSTPTACSRCSACPSIRTPEPSAGRNELSPQSSRSSTSSPEGLRS